MRIAVTGAAGHVGREVIRVLLATTDHEIVAVIRRPDALGPSSRVTPVVADYADEPALRRALTKTDTLVMISSDGPVARVMTHHANLVDAARSCGVDHVVALSGLDASPDSPFCYAQSYAHTERLLRASGCAYSIARASIFTEFFFALALDVLAGGQLRLPASDGRVSLVSRLDVARSLAALACGSPTATCHEITGPKSLDAHAVAAILQRQRSRPVTFVDTSPHEFSSRRALTGEDPWWTYAFTTMFDAIRQQRWSTVSDDARRLTRCTTTPAATVRAGGDADESS